MSRISVAVIALILAPGLPSAGAAPTPNAIEEVQRILPDYVATVYSASVDGTVYFVGGYKGGVHTNVFQLSTDGRNVEDTGINAQTAVSASTGLVAVSSEIIFFGTGSALQGITHYNPSTRQFHQSTARFPIEKLTTIRHWTEIRDATIAAAGGKAYIFGGHNGYGQAFEEIWRYDPTTEQLDQLDARIPGGIYGAKAVTVGPEIFLYGGIRARVLLDEVWKFRPAEATIAKMNTRFPVPTAHLAGIADHGQAYLFGGGPPFSDRIWRHDRESGSIVALNGRLPTPRAGMAVENVNGKFVLVGGSGVGTYRDIVLYSPERDSLDVSPSSGFKTLPSDGGIDGSGLGWDGKRVHYYSSWGPATYDPKTGLSTRPPPVALGASGFASTEVWVPSVPGQTYCGLGCFFIFGAGPDERQVVRHDVGSARPVEVKAIFPWPVHELQAVVTAHSIFLFGGLHNRAGGSASDWDSAPVLFRFSLSDQRLEIESVALPFTRSELWSLVGFWAHDRLQFLSFAERWGDSSRHITDQINLTTYDPKTEAIEGPKNVVRLAFSPGWSFVRPVVAGDRVLLLADSAPVWGWCDCSGILSYDWKTRQLGLLEMVVPSVHWGEAVWIGNSAIIAGPRLQSVGGANPQDSPYGDVLEFSPKKAASQISLTNASAAGRLAVHSSGGMATTRFEWNTDSPSGEGWQSYTGPNVNVQLPYGGWADVQLVAWEDSGAAAVQSWSGEIAPGEAAYAYSSPVAPLWLFGVLLFASVVWRAKRSEGERDW